MPAKTWVRSAGLTFARACAGVLAMVLVSGGTAWAAPGEGGGEANLQLPDLSSVQFLGMDGHRLLTYGILFCVTY